MSSIVENTVEQIWAKANAEQRRELARADAELNAAIARCVEAGAAEMGDALDAFRATSERRGNLYAAVNFS